MSTEQEPSGSGHGIYFMTSFYVQYKVCTATLPYARVHRHPTHLYHSLRAILRFFSEHASVWPQLTCPVGILVHWWTEYCQVRNSNLWIPPDPNIQPSGERNNKAESSQLQIRERVEKAEQKQ